MRKIPVRFRSKKLVVFDLDGTLAESKSRMDAEMAGLIRRLLTKKLVAVISGGRFAQFEKQFLVSLRAPDRLLKDLFLFPTTATSFYRFRNGGWRRVYVHELAPRDRQRIFAAFEKVFEGTGYRHPRRTYGAVIEDRGTQVTFSALGQDVVARLGQKIGVRLKDRWKRKNAGIKLKMARSLAALLPDLEVHAAGYTSIDVTAKGIDKAYGVRQIRDHLRIPIRDMLFVGDALFRGGNDYAARRSGIECVAVSGPAECKALIRELIV